MTVDDKMNDFIQTHLRAFFGDHKPLDDDDTIFTRYFELSPTSELAVGISVVVSTENDSLQLSYFLANGELEQTNILLDELDKLTRADFLWENTCFECFFDTGDSAYFELNFAPSGAYNLYRFDNYRTPDTLPPNQADGELILETRALDGFKSYFLTIKMTDISALDIININPTAILYQDGMPHFFAVNHATPPDFHNKEFWQEL